ncbi:trichodiene oxygenase [Fusarium mundagurra]|uniref:Trichodiene oxygenase n=1 Tax=Fusarium mundagurra TaxID=1567541 RepID=A0A8H5YEB9_9HYPO|nr:trichodiene oxygenase [Fusarium mundagurra]
MKLCFGKDMNCTQGKEGTSALADSMVSSSSATNVLNGPTKCARDIRVVSTPMRPPVFDAILDAEPDRSTKGLVDEVISLVIGGNETTVTTITYGVWGILKNPEVEKKMLGKLRTPYLTPVIHETLRTSSPAPGILTRLVPSGGTRYGSHFLPADTSVSIAQRLIHYGLVDLPEPETFMPETFMPERWLDNRVKASKNNLIPFSKGPRMCIGLNLSYMEAYVFLGNLIRRFDLSLHDKDQGTLR